MNSDRYTIIVMKAQHSVCARPILLGLPATVALMDTSVILYVNVSFLVLYLKILSMKYTSVC